MGFIIHYDKTVMILYELACSQTVLCKEKKLENKNVCLKVDSADRKSTRLNSSHAT